MTASVVVEHNFETAHRLPFLGGKCVNLHGHSWWVEVSVFGEPDNTGVLLEFGQFKADLREWVDAHLDHGAMLGAGDPLAAVLRDLDCKVFVFDGRDFCEGGGPLGRALDWPTVENVAELLRRVVVDYLGSRYSRALSVNVRVRETHVNAATAR